MPHLKTAVVHFRVLSSVVVWHVGLYVGWNEVVPLVVLENALSLDLSSLLLIIGCGTEALEQRSKVVKAPTSIMSKRQQQHQQYITKHQVWARFLVMEC